MTRARASSIDCGRPAFQPASNSLQICPARFPPRPAGREKTLRPDASNAASYQETSALSRQTCRLIGHCHSLLISLFQIPRINLSFRFTVRGTHGIFAATSSTE